MNSSDMVKIVITTEHADSDVQGCIVTEAQTRQRAIEALDETFNLNPDGWVFNTQSKVMGNTLFTWTLIKA